MSKWSPSTFQFSRRTPLSTPANPGTTAPSSGGQNNEPRADTPRPPTRLPWRPSSSNLFQSEEPAKTAPVDPAAASNDARTNVTRWCVLKDAELSETQRKLAEIGQEKENLRDELNRSIQNVARLEFVNQKLQENCDRLETRINRLESHCDETQRDHDKATKVLQLAQSIQAEMSSTFETFKTQLINDVRHKAKQEAEEQMRQLRAQFDEAEAKYEQACQDWRQHIDEQNRLEQEHRQLVETLTKDRDQFRQLLSETTTGLSSLTQDKMQLQVELEKARADLSHLQETFQSELSQKIGSTLEELQTDRSILASVRKKVAEKEEQLQSLGQQMDRLSVQLEEKNLEHKRLESERNEANARIQTLEAANSQLTRERSELTSERDELKQNHQKMTELLQVFQNQCDSSALACAEAREAAKDLTRDKLKLEQEALAAARTLEHVRHQLEKSESERYRIEIESKELNLRLQNESGKLEQVQMTSRELLERLKKTEEELADSNSQRKEQSDRLSRLESEHQGVLERLEHKEKQAERLTSQLEEMTELNRKSESEIHEMRQSLGEKDRILMEKAIEVEYKNRRIDALNATIENLRQEMANRDEPSVPDEMLTAAHRSQQLEASQARIQELVVYIDRLKENEKKSTAKLKYELQLARESQMKVESDLTQAQTTIAELRTQLTEAQRKLELERQKANLTSDPTEESTAGTKPEVRPQFHELQTEEDPQSMKKSVTFKDPNKELLVQLGEIEAKATDQSKKQTTSGDSAKKTKQKRLHLEKPTNQVVEASPVLKSGPPRSYGRTRSSNWTPSGK